MEKKLAHLGEYDSEDKLFPMCGDKPKRGERMLDPKMPDIQEQFNAANEQKQVCRHCLRVVRAQTVGFEKGMMSGLKMLMDKLRAAGAGVSGDMAHDRVGSKMAH